MDTFQGEVWKAIASKAANKVLYSSSAAINQQHYLSNYQGFSHKGAPYYYPIQFYFESSFIPKPQEIFGFEIYGCKKCSKMQAVIISFNDGKEAGSRINWSPCCDFATFSDLKKIDQNSFNDNKKQLQKIQDRLKYSVNLWTNNKPILTAIRIPESFRGNSVKLLEEGTHKSISLEYNSEKHIEIDVDDENHWAQRCVIVGTIAIRDNDLSDFLSKAENTTFGFFTVKLKEFKGIYLMAISNDIVVRRLRLV